MRSRLVSLAFAVVLVAGCGNQAPPVDWGGKYAPTVQKRLDDLIATKDCGSLQAEWHTAHAIDEAKKRSSGSGSADLVAYIEWGMDEAGCDQVKE